tara:strand:+ start:1674 stop:3119 length:1446 start_codon:yes stop_codon:yes gene_type:complete
MEKDNLLINDIDNILEDYDLNNISSDFKLIDEIIQSVLEILEQFHENLDYGNIYNKILRCIETKNQSDDYENIDENIDDLQLIEVNGETYENLDSMRNELLKTAQEVEDTKSEFLKQQYEHLLTVFQPEQRSPEWYEMRKGMCTASDICAILGEGKYKTRNDIILKKCGKGKPFTGNKYTLHGQIYEDVAIGIYESRHNYIKVYEFGLIAHPTVSCLGASPDGITPEGTMIEIKCPPKRVITGIVPHEYWCQMQIQLEVCNLQVCHFFECLIIQYNTKEEYLEDIYDKNNVNDLNIILQTDEIPQNYITVLDERRSSNGLEKGVIGSVLDREKNERKYIYPPMNLTTDDQEKYIDDFIDNNPGKFYVLYGKYIYWKLEKSSEKHIRRDTKWFAEVLPRIKSFWEEVEERRKRREHSCDDLLKPKTKRKIRMKKKKLNKIESGRLLIDESSDEEEDIVLLNNKPMEEIILNSRCLIMSDDSD